MTIRSGLKRRTDGLSHTCITCLSGSTQNDTHAYQRDRRADMTHRQTDHETSVQSGPALVGGRTDKQCTQELHTNVFHHINTKVHSVKSGPDGQMFSTYPWIEQATSKLLIVHTEQLVVLFSDCPTDCPYRAARRTALSTL